MKNGCTGKKKLAKKVLKHIGHDSKEFKGQLKDDKKLAKTLKKAIRTK